MCLWSCLGRFLYMFMVMLFRVMLVRMACLVHILHFLYVFMVMC
jgi:hypothetical protein